MSHDTTIVSAGMVTTVLMVAWIACAGVPEPSSERGPSLILLDSMVLQETDTAHVGRPAGLAVAPAGFWVTDLYQNRVLVFDRAGRFVGNAGGPGGGPGEFGGVAGAYALGPDGAMIAVADRQPSALEFFDTGTRRPLGAVRVEGVTTDVKEVGDSIWVAGIDRSTWNTIAILDDPGDLVGRLGSAPAVRPDRVVAPAPYSASSVISGTYGLAYLAPRDPEGAWIGFAATPYLLAVDGRGATVDSVFVPNRLRRGVPEDFVSAMDMTKRPYSELFGLASALMALERTPDGGLLAVHFDAELEGRLITGRVYVSVVDPKSRFACVDTELPVSDVGQPIISLAGDTLYVLDQRVRGTTALSVIRTWKVSTSGCTWLSAVDG